MGKDKKEKHSGVGDVVENLASFKTKDTLREEDIHLTREVTLLEQRYKENYQAVARLSASYTDCKEHNAISRYGDLKDMIKACITEEIMHKMAECCDAITHGGSGVGDGKGKAVSMLAASRKLSEISKVAAEKENEIHQLHKAEIAKDIEEKQKKKGKIERNFLRLRNRLEKLKRDYEDSKQHIPTKRYLVMKEIIKPLIRDEALKIDGRSADITVSRQTPGSVTFIIFKHIPLFNSVTYIKKK